jgi:hypothetical protein
VWLGVGVRVPGESAIGGLKASRVHAGLLAEVEAEADRWGHPVSVKERGRGYRFGQGKKLGRELLFGLG